jgi:hypothetical protein
MNKWVQLSCLGLLVATSQHAYGRTAYNQPSSAGQPYMQGQAYTQQGYNYAQPSQGYMQQGNYSQYNQGYTQGTGYYTQPDQGYSQGSSYVQSGYGQHYAQPNQGYTRQGYVQSNQGYVQGQGYTQTNQRYMQQRHGHAQAQAYSQPDQSLEAALQDLFTQHGLLLTEVILASSQNMPQQAVESGKAQLLQNSRQIADILASVAGAQSGKAFETLFNQHISIGSQFINALKAKNQNLADQLSEEAKNNGSMIARFFSNLNPSVPYANWQNMLDQHVQIEADQAKAYFQGDINRGNQLRDQSISQLREFANLIASALQKDPSENQANTHAETYTNTNADSSDTNVDTNANSNANINTNTNNQTSR